jgi:hypothetical protein
MKFWQLSALLRWGGYSVGNAARTPEWAHFEQWLLRVDHLVDTQDRKKLDAELPADFVRAVLSSIDMPFQVDHEGWVRVASRSDAQRECISALEAFDRFGGEVLEDALEKGVSHNSLFRKPSGDTSL